MNEPELADATRRSRLANERTYLAWMRTGFTALAVAVGAGKIVPSLGHVTKLPFELLGAGFAVFGVLLTVYGTRRYLEVDRAFDEGRFARLSSREALALTAVAAALGVATVALVFVR